MLNAHRASDASGEGFAVRLFRAANRRGFVRALSDQPTSLSAGFAKVCVVGSGQAIRDKFLGPAVFTVRSALRHGQYLTDVRVLSTSREEFETVWPVPAMLSVDKMKAQLYLHCTLSESNIIL